MGQISDFYEDKYGKVIEDLGNLLTMLAADCVVMFLSMETTRTSKIVADLFLNSEMEIGDISWTDGARYVLLTCSQQKIRESGLSGLMPTWGSTEGQGQV